MNSLKNWLNKKVVVPSLILGSTFLGAYNLNAQEANGTKKDTVPAYSNLQLNPNALPAFDETDSTAMYYGPTFGMDFEKYSDFLCKDLAMDFEAVDVNGFTAYLKKESSENPKAVVDLNVTLSSTKKGRQSDFTYDNAVQRVLRGIDLESAGNYQKEFDLEKAADIRYEKLSTSSDSRLELIDHVLIPEQTNYDSVAAAELKQSLIQTLNSAKAKEYAADEKFVIDSYLDQTIKFGEKEALRGKDNRLTYLKSTNSGIELYSVANGSIRFEGTIEELARAGFPNEVIDVLYRGSVELPGNLAEEAKKAKDTTNNGLWFDAILAAGLTNNNSSYFGAGARVGFGVPYIGVTANFAGNTLSESQYSAVLNAQEIRRSGRATRFEQDIDQEMKYLGNLFLGGNFNISDKLDVNVQGGVSIAQEIESSDNVIHARDYSYADETYSNPLSEIQPTQNALDAAGINAVRAASPSTYISPMVGVGATLNDKVNLTINATNLGKDYAGLEATVGIRFNK